MDTRGDHLSGACFASLATFKPTTLLMQEPLYREGEGKGRVCEYKRARLPSSYRPTNYRIRQDKLSPLLTFVLLLPRSVTNQRRPIPFNAGTIVTTQEACPI